MNPAMNQNNPSLYKYKYLHSDERTNESIVTIMISTFVDAVQ